MNFAKCIISGLCIGLLVSLAGCAKRNTYKPRQIPSLKESAHVDYQETKGLVTFRAKAFTQFDCDTIFGERADRITDGKNPLQPVQISIENNSPSVVELHDANIDLMLVPTKEVVDRLSGFNFKTAGICCGIGAIAAIASAGALFFVWPLALAHMVFFGSLDLLLVCVAGTFGLASVGGLLLIATPCLFIIDNSGNEKREIRECIAKTEMGKTIIVNSGKTVDVLLFVQKKQYKPDFTCSLIDQQQNKKRRYEVHLPAQN